MRSTFHIFFLWMFFLVNGLASTDESTVVPTTIFGFERPEVTEKIWPVFLHDPGKAGEMEVPQLDVLINREGKPIMLLPVNEIPENEFRTLRMIIPAMKYSAGNACDEPIEGYAKCVFDDYFVLVDPAPDSASIRAPQPKWRISSDLGGKLAYYSLTYKKSVGKVDFYLDAEGNVTGVKGLSKYGKVLASELFGPDKDNLKFLPAKLEGEPVESIVRLYLGKGKEIGRESIALRKSSDPYHRLRNWPEGLPLEESFMVDVDLILDDDGVVEDVYFLSQMPSELSTQLVVDLKSWKIDPAKIRQVEGAKSMRLKIAYNEENGNPDLLSVKVRPLKYKDPEPIDQKTPDYPISLLRDGISGVAIIVFTITEEGLVEDMEVDHADNPEFAKASMDAIREWKFKPAIYNGAPVAIRVRVPIPFTFSRN